ncbi:hypothetical protein [Tatumella sp. UBA2305]|uniref:hypothetical protein n=1 Tax=Tatumella sp. UBA2305 TaxID=1947647 RepID=UPI0025D6A68C|nr:hypothetical protein [Tatumella sp. UBA2305]
MTNRAIKGLLVLTTMAVLAGCQHKSDAIDQGRPQAAGGQSVPGGPVGQGPVGQPQS